MQRGNLLTLGEVPRGRRLKVSKGFKSICSRVTLKRKFLGVGLFLVVEMCQTILKGLNLKVFLKRVWAVIV